MPTKVIPDNLNELIDSYKKFKKKFSKLSGIGGISAGKFFHDLGKFLAIEECQDLPLAQKKFAQLLSLVYHFIDKNPEDSLSKKILKLLAKHFYGAEGVNEQGKNKAEFSKEISVGQPGLRQEELDFGVFVASLVTDKAKVLKENQTFFNWLIAALPYLPTEKFNEFSQFFTALQNVKSNSAEKEQALTSFRDKIEAWYLNINGLQTPPPTVEHVFVLSYLLHCGIRKIKSEKDNIAYIKTEAWKIFKLFLVFADVYDEKRAAICELIELFGKKIEGSPEHKEYFIPLQTKFNLLANKDKQLPNQVATKPANPDLAKEVKDFDKEGITSARQMFIKLDQQAQSSPPGQKRPPLPFSGSSEKLPPLNNSLSLDAYNGDKNKRKSIEGGETLMMNATMFARLIKIYNELKLVSYSDTGGELIFRNFLDALKVGVANKEATNTSRSITQDEVTEAELKKLVLFLAAILESKSLANSSFGRKVEKLLRERVYPNTSGTTLYNLRADISAAFELQQNLLPSAMKTQERKKAAYDNQAEFWNCVVMLLEKTPGSALLKLMLENCEVFLKFDYKKIVENANKTESNRKVNSNDIFNKIVAGIEAELQQFFVKIEKVLTNEDTQAVGYVAPINRDAFVTAMIEKDFSGMMLSLRYFFEVSFKNSSSDKTAEFLCHREILSKIFSLLPLVPTFKENKQKKNFIMAELMRWNKLCCMIAKNTDKNFPDIFPQEEVAAETLSKDYGIIDQSTNSNFTVKATEEADIKASRKALLKAFQDALHAEIPTFIPAQNPKDSFMEYQALYQIAYIVWHSADPGTKDFEKLLKDSNAFFANLDVLKTHEKYRHIGSNISPICMDTPAAKWPRKPKDLLLDFCLAVKEQAENQYGNFLPDNFAHTGPITARTGYSSGNIYPETKRDQQEELVKANWPHNRHANNWLRIVKPPRSQVFYPVLLSLATTKTTTEKSRALSVIAVGNLPGVQDFPPYWQSHQGVENFEDVSVVFEKANGAHLNIVLPDNLRMMASVDVYNLIAADNAGIVLKYDSAKTLWYIHANRGPDDLMIFHCASSIGRSPTVIASLALAQKLKESSDFQKNMRQFVEDFKAGIEDFRAGTASNTAKLIAALVKEIKAIICPIRRVNYSIQSPYQIEALPITLSTFVQIFLDYPADKVDQCAETMQALAAELLQERYPFLTTADKKNYVAFAEFSTDTKRKLQHDPIIELPKRLKVETINYESFPANPPAQPALPLALSRPLKKVVEKVGEGLDTVLRVTYVEVDNDPVMNDKLYDGLPTIPENPQPPILPGTPLSTSNIDVTPLENIPASLLAKPTPPPQQASTAQPKAAERELTPRQKLKKEKEEKQQQKPRNIPVYSKTSEVPDSNPAARRRGTKLSAVEIANSFKQQEDIEAKAEQQAVEAKREPHYVEVPKELVETEGNYTGIPKDVLQPPQGTKLRSNTNTPPLPQQPDLELQKAQRKAKETFKQAETQQYQGIPTIPPRKPTLTGVTNNNPPQQPTQTPVSVTQPDVAKQNYAPIQKNDQTSAANPLNKPAEVQPMVLNFASKVKDLVVNTTTASAAKSVEPPKPVLTNPMGHTQITAILTSAQQQPQLTNAPVKAPQNKLPEQKPVTNQAVAERQSKTSSIVSTSSTTNKIESPKLSEEQQQRQSKTASLRDRLFKKETEEEKKERQAAKKLREEQERKTKAGMQKFDKTKGANLDDLELSDEQRREADYDDVQKYN